MEKNNKNHYDLGINNDSNFELGIDVEKYNEWKENYIMNKNEKICYKIANRLIDDDVTISDKEIMMDYVFSNEEFAGHRVRLLIAYLSSIHNNPAIESSNDHIKDLYLEKALDEVIYIRKFNKEISKSKSLPLMESFQLILGIQGNFGVDINKHKNAFYNNNFKYAGKLMLASLIRDNDILINLTVNKEELIKKSIQESCFIEAYFDSEEYSDSAFGKIINGIKDVDDWYNEKLIDSNNQEYYDTYENSFIEETKRILSKKTEEGLITEEDAGIIFGKIYDSKFGKKETGEDTIENPIKK